jgi:hypothetical protein
MEVRVQPGKAVPAAFAALVASLTVKILVIS